MPILFSQPVQSAHRKRVLVVDDHELLRRGWRDLFAAEDDLEICGEAASVDEGLSQVEQLRPDVVITDLAFPGRNGLELVKDLRSLHPEIPVLVVSMYDEALFGERALKAGAFGYVMKEAASEHLVGAIRQVLLGEHYVSRALSRRYFAGMAAGAPPKFPIDRLTPKEMEVFELIGKGYAQNDIAKHLHVKPRTVEAHRTNMRKKLGLPNSKALLRYAVRCVESRVPSLPEAPLPGPDQPPRNDNFFAANL